MKTRIRSISDFLSPLFCTQIFFSEGKTGSDACASRGQCANAAYATKFLRALTHRGESDAALAHWWKSSPIVRYLQVEELINGERDDTMSGLCMTDHIGQRLLHYAVAGHLY